MNDFARPIDIKEGGRVQYGLDSGLLVEFYIKPKLMQALSEKRAMPTYEDRVYTRIVSPGNTKTTWDYETKGLIYQHDEVGAVVKYEVNENLSVEDCDPIRFPNAWSRFTKKNEKVNTGWAIEQWGAIPRSFAETLKAMNIHTVESLASINDDTATTFMGGLKFRNLARAALDEQKTLELASAEQERANKAAEENRLLKEQLAALQAQVNELSHKKGKAA